MKTSDRQSVMRDFLEAFGPVMPVAGKDAGALVGDVQLDAVTIELDLVDPARTAWRFLDRGGKRRFDETGEGRLDTDRLGLFTLKCD